jgi:hypothetical protein
LSKEAGYSLVRVNALADLQVPLLRFAKFSDSSFAFCSELSGKTPAFSMHQFDASLSENDASLSENDASN